MRGWRIREKGMYEEGRAKKSPGKGKGNEDVRERSE